MALIVVVPDIPITLRKSDFRHARSDVEVVTPPTVKATAATIEDADDPVAFVCPYMNWTDKYLDALSARDWVTATGAGYDNYPLSAFEEAGISFTNTPRIHGEAMSEHVFGMAFAFSRQLLAYHDQQRERRWNRLRTRLTDFAGEVCCVVGLGHVGEPIAERARAFQMTVRGVKRTPEGYDGTAHDVYPPERLREALDGAQLVVLAVPLTKETEGLIGAEELEAVSDDGIVINVARGPVLDEHALLSALNHGEIGGAGLDVFEEEPLAPSSPLWDRDEIIITPHCAANSDKYGQRFLEVFFEHYDQWRRGKEFTHQLV